MEAMQQMAAVAVVLLLLGAHLVVCCGDGGFAGVTLGGKASGAANSMHLERLSLGPAAYAAPGA
mgnify:CR=1 FL=1